MSGKGISDTSCHSVDQARNRVVEDVEVFKLISEVQSAAKDNSLIPFSSISEILNHLRKQWASLLRSLLSTQIIPPVTVPTEEPIDDDFERFSEKMQEFGFENLTQEDVTHVDSYLDLVRSKGGQVEDNKTDYRITLGDTIVHVGKAVMHILDEELQSIKNSL